MRRVWEIWAKSLGSKVGDDKEADIIAMFRTFWVVIHVVACFMIIIHNGIKIGWF